MAQAPEAAPLQVSESGEGYLDVVGRRVRSDVVYYDPNAAPPELTTREAPGPKPGRELSDRVLGSRHFYMALAAIVLALVLYQLWRHGAPVSVSLTARPGDAARPARPAGPAKDDKASGPMSLRDIMAMENREAAIVELARTALGHAAEQHGMRWQSSWTARELLRRLPATAAERLRPLVRTAEHVQFGNRSVGADEVARFARDIAPLLQGRGA